MGENRRAVVTWSAGVSAAAGTFAGILASRATTALSRNGWFIACVAVALATFLVLLAAGAPDLSGWLQEGRKRREAAEAALTPSPPPVAVGSLRTQQASSISAARERHVELATRPIPLMLALTAFSVVVVSTCTDALLVGVTSPKAWPSPATDLLVGVISGAGTGLVLGLLGALSSTDVNLGRSVAAGIVVIVTLIVIILIGGEAELGIAGAVITLGVFLMLAAANHVITVATLIFQRNSVNAARRAVALASTQASHARTYTAQGNIGDWQSSHYRHEAARWKERAAMSNKAAESAANQDATAKRTAESARIAASARTQAVKRALVYTAHSVVMTDGMPIAGSALGAAFAIAAGAAMAGLPGACISLGMSAGAGACVFAIVRPGQHREI